LNAEPAALPGLRTARTLYAALYGEFAPHPRPDARDEPPEDAYSLFYARSAAMGWLSPAIEGAQRARARITLDGLADPSIRTAAPAIVRWVREINQEVFDCESWSEDDHLVLLPAITFEGGPDGGHHRVTFRGTLAEWSLDALGWLAAFLADVGARHGVRTPLILTADRSAG
jgi:hypothetical protein